METLFWKPIIKNEKLKIAIADKIDLIREQLQAADEECIDLSLLTNTGGRVFFDFYYANYAFKKNAMVIDNSVIIEKTIEKAGETNEFLFSTGIVGILFLMDHLHKNEMIELDEEFFNVDESIFLQIQRSDYIDYLHGSGGFIFFLVEKELSFSKKHLELWCEKLYALAEKENNLFKWKTKVSEDQLAYCFGLAHGLPSYIILLIKISKKYRLEIANTILRKALNYLLSSINKDKSNGYFPYNITDKEIINSKRLSWCYGDLGCAMALYMAGNHLKNNEYTNLANEIFTHHANNRFVAANEIVDADFCHGSVGIAHIYARMYNYTDNELYRVTSEFWYGLTIEKARYDDVLSGYKHANNTEKKLEISLGLLEGISGIGLSFLSAITDIEPKWDRTFLLS